MIIIEHKRRLDRSYYWDDIYTNNFQRVFRSKELGKLIDNFALNRAYVFLFMSVLNKTFKNKKMDKKQKKKKEI